MRKSWLEALVLPAARDNKAPPTALQRLVVARLVVAQPPSAVSAISTAGGGCAT